jgi:AAA domain-containing protein
MSRRFQSGGALREGTFYVSRRADHELPDALCRGELCHVLAPRQMGKSSLRLRVDATLRARGVRACCVDLSALGSTEVTPEQWYFGLVDALARSLGLADPVRFWKSHGLLSPVLRWSRFLQSEIVEKLVEPVVIFLDEIDAVRSLPFSADDFFASIRFLYNARADDPACERLRFCMMGVATPGELMRDTARTPFNVGRGIRLADFSRAEAAAFLPGLSGDPEEADRLLDSILHWTEGHPYMTHRICEMLAEESMSGDVLPATTTVSRLVGDLFQRRGRVEDLCLSAVERVFTRGRSGPRVTEMLILYQRLVTEERVLAISDDPVQTALCLAGLAAERDDGASVWVRVRNPIVANVFDLAWVRERLAAR